MIDMNQQQVAGNGEDGQDTASGFVWKRFPTLLEAKLVFLNKAKVCTCPTCEETPLEFRQRLADEINMFLRKEALKWFVTLFANPARTLFYGAALVEAPSLVLAPIVTSADGLVPKEVGELFAITYGLREGLSVPEFVRGRLLSGDEFLELQELWTTIRKG